MIKAVFLFLSLLVSASKCLHPDLIGRKFDTRSNVKLYCYDRPNCEGIRVEFGTNKVVDLSQPPYFFDNRIVSCLFYGMFILYDGIYFNENNLNGATYGEAFGDDKCINMKNFSNMASSIRLAGHHIYGWRGDSINLYEGEFYNGLETFAYDDTEKLHYDNFGRSMIITGCQPWTLYEHPYFQGQSACWYPAENCYPSFFRTADTMKKWDNQISSVRKGCYSELKFYG